MLSSRPSSPSTAFALSFVLQPSQFRVLVFSERGGRLMKRGFYLVVAVLAACLLTSTHAFAQGGGASTTGSINGKVADSSGGVLPGVTVSATSTSMRSEEHTSELQSLRHLVCRLLLEKKKKKKNKTNNGLE